MKIFYTHRAAKELEALSLPIQRRIAEKMRFYASEKDPLRFAKRLTDARLGTFRFRIGDYRIIFDVSGNSIYVLHIAKRDEVYD